jgi:N-acetylglutamate synthase-like GNAT family acetyltransferase
MFGKEEQTRALFHEKIGACSALGRRAKALHERLYLAGPRAMIRIMTAMNQQVRRATIEDVPKLVPLWQRENLRSQDLEKRFKEFQVVEGPGGEVLGALGMQIAGQEARLHSEVFAHHEQADALRQKLWERAGIVASNFGLIRLWTQFSSPFWNQTFEYASADMLAKLPPSFGAEAGPWKFVQLRSEAAAPLSIDKEFALFKQAEKERTDQMFRQARILKIIAVFIAIAVFILVGIWAVVFFKMQGRTMGR